eukprot:TRINITY_DN6593_c0_g1_i1.p1 TRINITY_DN6593_c0_g1~~TRINITY_DN6593_c0_g1_i1.p1  ORF type:complete len:480 (-),score=136.35 TRINITY_DN6593_c0_g1_i1:103-1542(-)
MDEEEQTNNLTSTKDASIKEELDPLNIKEEPIQHDNGDKISENATEFVAVDIKTEEPFSDDEFVTDDDAVAYMLTNAFETEFVDVGPQLLGPSEIKTEKKQALPTDTKSKFKLRKISFLNAATQIEKYYQIKLKSTQNEFKDYLILTSVPESNNTNIEWKLFIPVTSNPLQPHGLSNISVDYDPESDRFDFSYSSNNLIVKHIEDLKMFMQGIMAGKNLLLTQQNLQSCLLTFSNQSFPNGNNLIPTFTIREEESTFIFQTEMENVGNEEVPKISEENYPHLLMLTSAFFCKPKLTINGVPYQLSTASGYVREHDHDISDIKAKYEAGQYITDEELDPLIKVLSSKIMKTPLEKQEIKRLKTRRRNRKCRHKMSEEQREERKKQVREQKREQYHKMSDEEKEAKKKHAREQKKARYHQMSEEEKEVLRKRVREQKKEQYHQMSAEQKESLRKRNREQKKARYMQMNTEGKQEGDSWDHY